MTDRILPGARDAVCRMELATDMLGIAMVVDRARTVTGPRFRYEVLSPRLKLVRRTLPEIEERTPLVQAAVQLVADIDVWLRRPDVPVPDTTPMRTAIYNVLRADLPEAPRTPADWESGCHRLAAVPWIGRAVWSCPLGWLPLVERAAGQVRHMVGGSGTLWHWKTHAMEERHGTLDWRIDLDFPGSSMLTFAETASDITCMACGNLGQLRPGLDWDLTLCDVHALLEECGPPGAIGRLAYGRRPGGQ